MYEVEQNIRNGQQGDAWVTVHPGSLRRYDVARTVAEQLRLDGREVRVVEVDAHNHEHRKVVEG